MAQCAESTQKNEINKLPYKNERFSAVVRTAEHTMRRSDCSEGAMVRHANVPKSTYHGQIGKIVRICPQKVLVRFLGLNGNSAVERYFFPTALEPYVAPSTSDNSNILNYQSTEDYVAPRTSDNSNFLNYQGTEEPTYADVGTVVTEASLYSEDSVASTENTEKFSEKNRKCPSQAKCRY